jgi:hypothetical protein
VDFAPAIRQGHFFIRYFFAQGGAALSVLGAAAAGFENEGTALAGMASPEALKPFTSLLAS